MYIYIYIYLFIHLHLVCTHYAVFVMCVTAIKSSDTMRVSHEQVPVAAAQISNLHARYVSYVRNLKDMYVIIGR